MLCGSFFFFQNCSSWLKTSAVGTEMEITTDVGAISSTWKAAKERLPWRCCPIQTRRCNQFFLNKMKEGPAAFSLLSHLSYKYGKCFRDDFKCESLGEFAASVLHECSVRKILEFCHRQCKIHTMHFISLFFFLDQHYLCWDRLI